MEFISGRQGWSTICKSFNVTYPINRLKNKNYMTKKQKNHMIISIHTEKTFNKIQHHSWYSPESSYRGNNLSVIKAIYNKPIANITLDSEKLQVFPLRSGTGKCTIIIQNSIQSLTHSNQIRNRK